MFSILVNIGNITRSVFCTTHTDPSVALIILVNIAGSFIAENGSFFCWSLGVSGCVLLWKGIEIVQAGYSERGAAS